MNQDSDLDIFIPSPITFWLLHDVLGIYITYTYVIYIYTCIHTYIYMYVCIMKASILKIATGRLILPKAPFMINY